MAFGKKKDKELARAVEAAAAEIPPTSAMPEEPDDDDPPLLIGDEGDAPGQSDEAAADGALTADAAPGGETDLVASPAEGSDALLSMFDTGELETSDLSAVVALAGDVDLDDLLEELQTVAAALGITATHTPAARAAA